MVKWKLIFQNFKDICINGNIKKGKMVPAITKDTIDFVFNFISVSLKIICQTILDVSAILLPFRSERDLYGRKMRKQMNVFEKQLNETMVVARMVYLGDKDTIFNRQYLQDLMVSVLHMCGALKHHFKDILICVIISELRALSELNNRSITVLFPDNNAFLIVEAYMAKYQAESNLSVQVVVNQVTKTLFGNYAASGTDFKGVKDSIMLKLCKLLFNVTGGLRDILLAIFGLLMVWRLLFFVIFPQK
eukprot:337825_1